LYFYEELRQFAHVIIRVFCYESFHKFLSLHVQHRLDDRLQIRLNNATTPCPCTEGLGSLRRFRRSSTGHAIFCCRFLGAKYSTGKWARAELISGKFWHSQDFGVTILWQQGFSGHRASGRASGPSMEDPAFFLAWNLPSRSTRRFTSFGPCIHA